MATKRSSKSSLITSMGSLRKGGSSGATAKKTGQIRGDGPLISGIGGAGRKGSKAPAKSRGMSGKRRGGMY